MRLQCPYCGERDLREFSYRGDATLTRPATDAEMADYVYLRDNPKGWHREYWLHTVCRTWLEVERNTMTHALGEIVPARVRRVAS
jgi:heterotetrameric sarcosine oxidase delta subunit